MNETPHRSVHRPRLEQTLLWAMLRTSSALHGTIAFGITEEDFFDTRHKAIFNACAERVALGKPVNNVFIAEDVVTRGLCEDEYMVEIMTLDEFGECFWKEYCIELREYTIARRAFGASQKIAEASTDIGLVRDIGPISRGFLEDLESMRPRHSVNLADQVAHAFRSLDADIPTERFGFGLHDLDSAINGGALKGNLVVIAGDTGKGKSILLGMAALEAMLANHFVSYYSIEMPEDEVLLRLGASLARRPMIPKWQMQTAEDRQASKESEDIICATKLTLRCHLTSIDEIVNDAIARVNAGKCDVVVVDYIQRCACDEGDNRSQNVAAISRKLAQLSMAGCAVFAGSQINKEGEVFESRAIRNDANIIIAIEQQDGRPQLLVAKNRRGQAGIKIPMTLRGDISRFE